MDTLQCPHCQSKGLPHLVHYQPWPSALRYKKTQHMCRICGEVMYETGGRWSFGIYIILLLAGDLFLQVGNQAWHDEWWWKISLPLAAFSLAGLFVYKLVKIIINIFR